MSFTSRIRSTSSALRKGVLLMLDIKKALTKLMKAPIVVEEGGTGVHTSWYYRKWSDGKLECWIKKEYSTKVETAWGSLYYAPLANMPDYPVNFYYMPVAVTSVHVVNGNGWVTTNQANAGVNNIGTQFVISPTKITSAVAVFVNCYVIGRWK